MLRREIPASPPLANRQPTESCSWHVARETVARHHDPYRSHHRSLGRARFLRDESRCRFCERRRRCCFQSTPSLLKPGVPRLHPLPPGWPRSLITIGSGSFSKQSSACVSLAKSRTFPLADCEGKDERENSKSDPPKAEFLLAPKAQHSILSLEQRPRVYRGPKRQR